MARLAVTLLHYSKRCSHGNRCGTFSKCGAVTGSRIRICCKGASSLLLRGSCGNDGGTGSLTCSIWARCA